MQFQVPQFIEVEDTVFGPFTFKQFLYLAGGVGLCFIWYVYLPIYIAFFFIIATGIFTWALAFYKYNGRNFIYIAESATKYFFNSKLYLWKRSLGVKTEEKVVLKTKIVSSAEGVNLPRLSESKLKDLSWSLDVQSGIKNADDEIEAKPIWI